MNLYTQERRRKRPRLQCSTTPQVRKLVLKLHRSGLFGPTMSQTVERLLVDGILQHTAIVPIRLEPK